MKQRAMHCDPTIYPVYVAGHKILQQPDTKPGNYYVSAVDNGRFARLLGPFPNDHEAALNMVDRVRAEAAKIDPRAHWWAFGTARLDAEEAAKPGVLNARFGVKA